MHMAWDPCRYVLGLAVTAPAGQEFFYNTGALTLISAIIRKATGRPLDEFARATLFEPLGITSAEWTRVRGDTDAGGGLRLRPRDMAKIGQLVLAGGRWNDRQIVSKGWVETSTTPKIEAPTVNLMDTCGGSAAPCTMGVRSTGLARLVEAGSRFASSRSSVSLS
jgi:CubicO group peptidase (beta-lactamase class C family)